MKILATLLSACLLAACSADTPPPSLAEGTWTGTLTPMNHPDMHTSLTYQVQPNQGTWSITIEDPNGAALHTRDVHLADDTLSFVFNEPEAQVLLTCNLGRQAEGGYAGRCQDDSGKWAQVTMIPPDAE